MSSYHHRGSEYTRRTFLGHSALAASLATVGSSPLRAVPQSSPAIVSTDWPRFGCDLRNSRFNAGESTIGRENVGNLALDWTFSAGAPIQNCPAIVGDTLYFGSWDGYYYAVHSQTGELKWKVHIGVPPYDNGWHNIRSSPEYSEGRIYFGTGDARVVCLDAETGKEVWQTLLDNVPTNEPQISCSPMIYKGMVFIGSSSGHAQIACLDAQTGKVRWRFYTVPSSQSAGGSVWTSPAIDEEYDILYNVTGSTKGFMPAGPMLYTESIVAHDLHTGQLLWFDQPRPADVHDLDFGSHPMIFDAASPLQRGARRYCVGAGKKEGFFCWDRYTGELYWKAMLTNVSPSGGPRMSSTAVANNRVVVVSNAMTPKGAMSVTAALHAYTGEIEWWLPNSATVRAPVAIANGVFYQGLLDGSLEALDIRTGRQLWQYQLPSSHRGGFAISGGRLYTSNGELSLRGKATTDQHSIYAFSLGGG